MNVFFRRCLTVFYFSLFAGHAGASGSADNWKATASVSARTGYDDNVFLQERSAVIAPNGVLDHAGSWVDSVSLALDATWKPSAALALDTGYSPELTRYTRFSSENHDDHRFTSGLTGKNGAWSYDAKGSLLIVDGSSESPIFGHGGGAPAIGGEQIRARRDQTADKAAANITYTVSPEAFMRAVGAANFQDFQTDQKPTTGIGSTPGYANYVDRSEWSAGLDAGWFIRKNLALITGVRFGEQRQANLLGVKDNYSNRLTRFLAGLEGKIGSTFSLKFLAGPDIREYTDATAPGFDRTQSTRYAEGTATWTPTPADTIGFAMKDYLWLSSGGRSAYENMLCDLTWKHSLSKIWCTNAGFNYQEGDNRDYVTPAAYRNDSIYTVSGGITYALTNKTKIGATLSREWSDSAIPNKPGREYVHWLVSTDINYTF